MKDTAYKTEAEKVGTGHIHDHGAAYADIPGYTWVQWKGPGSNLDSLRRECLDYVIVWNERALRRHLQRYLAYTTTGAHTWPWRRTRPFRGRCNHRPAAP